MSRESHHGYSGHQRGLAVGDEKQTRRYKKKLQVLTKAIARGDADTVKSILETVDVSDRCYNELTPLALAVQKNRDDMVQLILSYHPKKETLREPFSRVMRDVRRFSWTTVEEFLRHDVTIELIPMKGVVWTPLGRYFDGVSKGDSEKAQRLITLICTQGSDVMKAALFHSLLASNKFTSHTGGDTCACHTHMRHLEDVFRLGLDPRLYLDSRWERYRVRHLTGCGICHKRHPLCSVCETSQALLPSAQCMSYMSRVATAANSRHIHQWALEYLDNPQVLVPQIITRGLRMNRAASSTANIGDYSEYWNVAVLLLRCGECPTTELWHSLFYWDSIPKTFTVQKNKMALGHHLRPLSDLCRLCLRRNIYGPNLVWSLAQIHYPEKLKQYILFTDEDYVTKLCEKPESETDLTP